jgi:hypothetical protein
MKLLLFFIDRKLGISLHPHFRDEWWDLSRMPIAKYDNGYVSFPKLAEWVIQKSGSRRSGMKKDRLPIKSAN